MAVRPALAQVGVDEMELLVVNDGSRDRTAEVAQQVAGDDPGVRMISHPKNRGYGAALKTGFAQANGELVGFLDADGTYPPEYFPQLCAEALKGADLVIGSRMAGAEQQDARHPPDRQCHLCHPAQRVGLAASDRQRQRNARFRNAMFCAKSLPLPDGLNLTPVMSTRAVHEGIKMVEVPIPYSERVGRSKLSVIRDGRIFLQSMVWTVLTYNPVRVLGILGLIGTGIAGLIALGLVIARLSGVTSLGPWGVAALFTALVMGVIGISLFALGATFNYLVSLFYETPIRQGLFGKPVFKTSAGKQLRLDGRGQFHRRFPGRVNQPDLRRVWRRYQPLVVLDAGRRRC